MDGKDEEELKNEEEAMNCYSAGASTGAERRLPHPAIGVA
jgi:hypothetical protein